MSDDPVNPFPRTLYNNDFRLVAQTREAIDRSRQKLRETRPLVDPHRLSPLITRNAVSISDTRDGWRVVVAECGVGTITRSFRERVPAFNFAEAQLMRLGLDKMTDN
ncbi:hypothetical protein CK215_26440 [Mesorhizobium sp. WSM3864]|uniref:hypothetical protein n=1 Tax=Mesorhizobium sp. WSM3864 TaxID=2029404 RepID=UPI000BAFB4DA|nr:hypothetical protein [Mesorhizobium sp. WSM3864]PBB89584.1 hypothetical protein CK215_26440 [Mesorhizobium sp. WSM3864]